MKYTDLPNWDNIPEVPGLPEGCAWGLFDQDGRRDQVGTLNLLTREKVLGAKDEIQHGDSVCLNWDLQHAQLPAANRKKFDHRIVSLRHLGYEAYDDEITINTQSSSQWDGFSMISFQPRCILLNSTTGHWAHQATGLHYNNLKHEAIQDVNCKDNSIHYWSLRGGIVGRGVLIDYHAWAKANNVDHPAFERTCISAVDIEQVAKAQGVELLPADILIIRTGWTERYNSASDAERDAGTTGDKHIGLEGTEETVKWLWNKHFAAVASDTLAFEAWPTRPPYSLHDWLLAMWGCPIGELWDLERLAQKCQFYNKWSFFVASAPLNVIGGVASPPNIVAIF